MYNANSFLMKTKRKKFATTNATKKEVKLKTTSTNNKKNAYWVQLIIKSPSLDGTGINVY